MTEAKRQPSNDLLETIANNIKKIRQEKSITQDQLAELCEFHHTFISLVERKKRNITISTVEVIATALGVPPYTLLKP